MVALPLRRGGVLLAAALLTSASAVLLFYHVPSPLVFSSLFPSATANSFKPTASLSSFDEPSSPSTPPLPSLSPLVGRFPPSANSDSKGVKSSTTEEESLLPPTAQFPLPITPLSPPTPIISTTVVSPPPFLAPSPSPTTNSDANGLKSSSGDLKVPPLGQNTSKSSLANGEESILQPPKASGSPPILPLKSEIPITIITAADRKLMRAKKEMDCSLIIWDDDPDLYAPLFRNVSVFKRSYKLMERILKVYIYQDGAIPIFHTPWLQGIYASEGWFMKLMEENKKFVTKDPNKAHLFYLPYSSLQLRVALYKPDSHNIKPLSVFLKDYVNTITAKYPFWNRTRGADHFLVACHDWGPYTTRLHDELRKNTIKAICNADLSEGVFIQGKDVSLPETNIRTPQRPLKDIGGKPVSKRSILAFFAGQMHGRVRPILLNYWIGKDKDMKIYGAIPNRIARKMSYIQHMKSSKFCICPMGYEVNSPRIVEAIYYECVPVIIADNFVPPFDEVLDWSTFSVIVAEKDIPNLKNILLGISRRKYVTMQGNVKRLQRHFLWHSRPVKYDIFHMILHSVWFSRLNQIQIHQ